ncbi:MAG: hypothetical protein ACOYL6_10795 [Bacteriovoracaceae bacterium]
MYFFLSFVLTALFTSLAWSSGLACIDPASGNITVFAHYYFYGTFAQDQYTRPCIDEVNRMFNKQFQVMLQSNPPMRKVNFQLTFVESRLSDAYSFAHVNNTPLFNFIRLEKRQPDTKEINSFAILNGNSGVFLIDNDLGTSTTCAHELSHGFGLTHYENQKGECDFRGKGVPGIMAARGCLVDAKYQYDPKVAPGLPGGSVNPIHRQVLSSDIKELKLGSLKYDISFKGYQCAPLGKADNYIYNQLGEIVL